MKSDKSLISLVLVLMAASLACSAVSNLVATPTPLPTWTPLPTSTPLSTSTPIPTSTQAAPPTPALVDVILDDDFSNSGSGWGTGTDSESSVEYVDEGLRFQVFSDRYVTWSNPDEEKYSGIHLEVTVRNNSTDPLSMFGFICHEQDSQVFYYLGVAGDGYFAIAKSAADSDNVFYADGNSTVVPSGSEPFTLAADCGAGNLALYVNGELIASGADSSFTNGYVGLFAWSDKLANSADVTFDNFLMTSLP